MVKRSRWDTPWGLLFLLHAEVTAGDNREGTLLKIKFQLWTSCTPVGDDSTVSLDIVKLHSGMIPEPRERGMWLYLLVWSVCVCWKHTANQHCVYAVRLDNEICRLDGELHMHLFRDCPPSITSQRTCGVVQHSESFTGYRPATPIKPATCKEIWHQDDNRWHQ